MGNHPRIFLSPEAVGESEVSFSREELHRLRKVLRLREGDELTVTDGTGREYLVRLGSEKERLGRIETIVEISRESPLRTILVQAVPKADRMSRIIESAVEIGVTDIWPLVSERTVVSLSGDRMRARYGRWRKVMEAAVGQSGRTEMPELAMPRPWKEVLAASGDIDMKVLLWEKGRTGFGELFPEGPRPESLLLAVGPEGGWTEGEVGLAAAAGFEAVAFGSRILRTSTAALAALGVTQYLFGDLGGGR